MMRHWLLAGLVLSSLGAAALAQTPPLGGGAPGTNPAPPPPPPGNTQLDLDNKYKQYMAGEWVLSYTAMGMSHVVTILYRPDGSLIGTDVVTQYGTLTYPVKGTWRVTGIDDQRFMLNLTVVGSNTGTSTDELRVIDQNTLFSNGAQEYVYRKK